MGVLRSSGTPTAAYATMAAVEALAAVVCEPGSRTTDPILRHALLSEAGALGRPLFALFSHPASVHINHPTTASFTHLISQYILFAYSCMPVNQAHDPEGTDSIASSQVSVMCVGDLAGRVLDAAALVMRAVAEGGANAAAPMREAALSEGAMLHHLSVGMSSVAVCGNL